MDIKELVSVSARRTMILCVVCNADLALPNTNCPLHSAVKRFQDRALTLDELVPVVGDALQRVGDSSMMDRTTYLEMLCGYCGLVELIVVKVSDLYAAEKTSRVTFDSSSEERFAVWLKDKLGRCAMDPHIRYQYAMNIREVWKRHPEGRALEAALKAAEEAAVAPLAKLEELRDRIAGHEKGVANLQKVVNVDETKREGRLQKIAEKTALAAVLRQEMEELRASSKEVLELAKCRAEWNAFLEGSGLGAALNELVDYNASVVAIRSGSVGKEGLIFEHECLRIVQDKFNPQKDAAIRIWTHVFLPGVQFPEGATGEFDMFVVKDNQVLYVVEVKRSAGAVRGNMIKKAAAMEYLLSDAFRGVYYEGVHLTRESFTRFAPETFHDHVYFIAREPVTVRPNEDVFGMFLDNEDAFLASLMQLSHLELGSDEFVHGAYVFVTTQYPMTDDDVKTFREGSALFINTVKAGRVLLVSHLLKPDMFHLPLRHKSSVRLSKSSSKLLELST